MYNNNCFNTQTPTQQELPKYRVEQNPTYQTDSLKKEMKKKLFAEADSVVDKFLFCPRIKPSNSLAINLDGVETGVLLSDFAQQLRRENEDTPDIYFTLLDAAGVSPNLALNQNASVKLRGNCFPLQILKGRSSKVSTRRRALLMGLRAIY